MMELVFCERADDCLAACVATILGRKLGDVHYVSALQDDGTAKTAEAGGVEFWEAWDEWFKSKGIRPIYNGVEGGARKPLDMEAHDVPDGLWIANTIDTMRGADFPHAVVMDGRRLFHDPADAERRHRDDSMFVFGSLKLVPSR